LGRQLIHAEDGDDVLEVFVTLERLLYATSNIVVLLTDHFRLESGTGAGQRIDGRVDAQFGNLPAQNGGGIQVSKRRGWRRIGQVVGRNVNRLPGGDGAFLGGRNPLLQLPLFVGQCRLVPDGRRHASEQRRYL